MLPSVSHQWLASKTKTIDLRTLQRQAFLKGPHLLILQYKDFLALSVEPSQTHFEDQVGILLVNSEQVQFVTLQQRLLSLEIAATNGAFCEARTNFVLRIPYPPPHINYVFFQTGWKRYCGLEE